MSDTDLMALEQVAIDELIDQVDRWSEPGSSMAKETDTESGNYPRHRYGALGRLEELGLITRARRRVPGGEAIAITTAGVEALAYLAAIP